MRVTAEKRVPTSQVSSPGVRQAVRPKIRRGQHAYRTPPLLHDGHRYRLLDPSFLGRRDRSQIQGFVECALVGRTFADEGNGDAGLFLHFA